MVSRHFGASPRLKKGIILFTNKTLVMYRTLLVQANRVFFLFTTKTPLIYQTLPIKKNYVRYKNIFDIRNIYSDIPVLLLLLYYLAA
jgi:hypothetical protein